MEIHVIPGPPRTNTHSGRVLVRHHSWDSGKHRYPPHGAPPPAHSWRHRTESSQSQRHSNSREKKCQRSQPGHENDLCSDLCWRCLITHHRQTKSRHLVASASAQCTQAKDATPPGISRISFGLARLASSSHPQTAFRVI